MTNHRFRIACPYCGKGNVSVHGELVLIQSTGPFELEQLSGEYPRSEAGTTLCEHFIAAHVGGYLDEEWHTERMPWLPETISGCKAMCEHPGELLSGMQSQYSVVHDSIETELGRLECTAVFAATSQAFVLELLPRMFTPQHA